LRQSRRQVAAWPVIIGSPSNGSDSRMSSLATRKHQMFPVLDAAQMEIARRFASGPARHFAPHETLYAIGEAGAPAWFVLEGTIDIVRRDGLNPDVPITTHRAGQFSGEVNQLAGRPSIAAGRAGPGGCLALTLSGGRRVQARSVVVASGARYRRPAIPDLATFEGAGVSYWASPIEARLCSGEEVALVGGGNSAGQAVVFLAPHVKRLHLIIRRDVAATMSRYLIDRIAALPNVEIHVGAEITRLEGDRVSGMTSATVADHADGTAHRRDLHHVFLFIGAEPNAEWSRGQVATDAKGFIVTGEGALPLETTLPGYSRSVMCGPVPPSASPPRSARARRSWRRSTPCWRIGPPGPVAPYSAHARSH
jgi:thioredoxin reductase